MRKKIIIISVIIFIAFIIIFLIIESNKMDPNGINLSEYEKIENGMTLTEVEDIIGKRNHIKSEQIKRVEDSSSTVYTYKYYGEKNGYAIITYELDVWNNKGMLVISKENFNIK